MQGLKQLSSIRALVVDFWASITVEPAIFFLWVGLGILTGSEVETNFKLWKACSISLGYNDTICDDLSAEGNDHIQDETQVYLNKFEIVNQYISSTPVIIYSMFIGALSDKYGRKALILAPIFGSIIDDSLALVHVTFQRTLPMTFFYIQNFFNWFGGPSVYYLGIYSYGSDVTDESNRSTRLARFDGFEMGSFLIGTLLSPYVFKWGGYYGSYGTRGILSVCSFCFVLFAVTESLPKAEKEHDSSPKTTGWFRRLIVDPFTSTLRAIFRPREGHLRLYVFCLFGIYGCYWAAVSLRGSNEYLYLRKTFKGFTGEDFSHFNVYLQVLNMICLFVGIPIMKDLFKWDEATIGVLITACQVVGLICQAMAANMFPQFYLATFIMGAQLSVYSIARSQFTKCVHPNEVGKIFAAVAITASVMQLAIAPLGKLLYNATITTYPG
eukprot:TCALIF_06312-PA protein Name:"Similar to slc46a1 Proton-coupled folate transporter (Xenopus laevis)" AED:0.00 eAED:0.00 QI:52/1/1/1/0.8/1/6/0/439